MKLKAGFCFVIATAFLIGSASSADVFPVFHTAKIDVIIPTNTPGLLADSSAEKKSTNIIYHLKGQIFTNSFEGQLQSKSEGFNGTSDKSTPWKTLTELFAVYQEGSPENKMKSLYSSSSRGFLDKIYKNQTTKERFQSFGSLITNMQAIAWHENEGNDDGSFAYAKVFYRDGRHTVMPYYLVKRDEKYELASKTFAGNSTNNIHQNITLFLDSSYSTNFIH